MNAQSADEGSARSEEKEPWRTVQASLGSGRVLIRLGIQGSQPLAGTATTEGGEPLRFEGWLDLLVVVSELVAAAPSSHEDADAAGWPDYQGRRPQVTSRSAAAQHVRDLAWLRRVRDRIDGTTPSR